MRLHVLLRHLLVPLLLVYLVACGGPGGGRTLTPDDAWTGPVPDDATMLSEEQFRRMLDGGQLDLITPGAIAAQAEARDRQFEQDVAFLRALTNPSQAVLDLLADLDEQAGFGDDIPLDLGDGTQVSLLGIGHQVRQAVESERLAADAGNALAVYGLIYQSVPDSTRHGAPLPASLTGATAAQIDAALADLDALLASQPNLGGASLEPAAVPPAYSIALEPQASGVGAGKDNNGPCAATTGLAATHWFPLKNFLPPMKDQGSRGTCWAFTSIGAVETRELVQNDNAVNLSEQFLVNQVKQQWEPDAYSEGYSEWALNLAVSKRQSLMPESSWTYNSSPNRADPNGSTAAAYVGACNPYGTGANAGSCSQTAHQSPFYCSYLIVGGTRLPVCGYQRMTYTGAGTPSGNTRQVWRNGDEFKLASYTELLRKGHVLLASFPVYAGFHAAGKAEGVVTDFSKTVPGVGRKKAGNHLVQVVGFISNAAMSTPGNAVNIAGGGYFVVKNSWGCGAGDGGYYYVPADYVRQIFNRLSVLEFDARRSSAWQAEQRTPGTYDAPSITVTSPGIVGLRVAADLTDFFAVTHPVATGVTLTIMSDVDGQIYSGGFSTDRMAFPVPLMYTFSKAGARNLTLTATHGRQSVTAKLVISVRNQPPTIQLIGSGTAYEGEPYGVTAIITDPNESSQTALCANTRWSVAAPDTLSTSNGCTVRVTFSTIGARTVTATTRDSDGASTTQTLSVDVQAPPDNPYPRISSAGVYQRVSPAGAYFCSHLPVTDGVTIDLTSRSGRLCRPAGTTSDPLSYYASVSVENPTSEPLTYDWQSFVTYNGVSQPLRSSLGNASSSWDLGSPGNTGLSTAPCHVTVSVNAPDPSRSRSTTVWSGRCTYYATRLN